MTGEQRSQCCNAPIHDVEGIPHCEACGDPVCPFCQAGADYYFGPPAVKNESGWTIIAFECGAEVAFGADGKSVDALSLCEEGLRQARS